jgi:hypothetical protein
MSTATSSEAANRNHCNIIVSTAALDAGVPLRDVQQAASHADPRTTMRYDRACQNLDRHATYMLRPARPWFPGTVERFVILILFRPVLSCPGRPERSRFR